MISEISKWCSISRHDHVVHDSLFRTSGAKVKGVRNKGGTAEHFDRHLAVPCKDDERKRQLQAKATLDTAASVTR